MNTNQQFPDLAAFQVEGATMPFNATAQAVQTAKPTGLAAVASTATTQNIEAAKLAASIKAGEAVLAAVKAMLVKALPANYAGYLENEFVMAGVANAVAALIRQVRPGNERAEQLANLLIQAAWFKIGNKIDVDAIFEELFSKLDTSRFGI